MKSKEKGYEVIKEEEMSCMKLGSYTFYHKNKMRMSRSDL